jgi:hypothetical protein
MATPSRHALSDRQLAAEQAFGEGRMGVTDALVASDLDPILGAKGRIEVGKLRMGGGGGGRQAMEHPMKECLP